VVGQTRGGLQVTLIRRDVGKARSAWVVGRYGPKVAAGHTGSGRPSGVSTSSLARTTITTTGSGLYRPEDRRQNGPGCGWVQWRRRRGRDFTATLVSTCPLEPRDAKTTAGAGWAPITTNLKSRGLRPTPIVGKKRRPSLGRFSVRRVAFGPPIRHRWGRPFR